MKHLTIIILKSINNHRLIVTLQYFYSFFCTQKNYSFTIRKNYTMNYFRTILMLTAMSLLLVSCEYEFIEVTPPDPTVEVKFSSEIVPIFSANNCINCHKAGGTSPDLTAANAYNSIYPSLVNLSSPELSTIYVTPVPSGNHPVKYTPNQAALVLEWIKQGAKNN